MELMYCPRCGTKRITTSLTSEGEECGIYKCLICRQMFVNSIEGRWRAKKFSGTNFKKKEPIIMIALNPNDTFEWRKINRVLKGDEI